MTPEERQKDSYLRRTYGISIEKYQLMLAKQEFRCAICHRLFGEKRRANVDHNHKTGKVRGLLCYRCNKFMVGRHTIATIKPVYEYLRKRDK